MKTFIFFVICIFFRNILSRECQTETNYYLSMISELQTDRESLKQELVKLSKDISSLKEENKKFKDYMNRPKNEEYVLFPTKWAHIITSRDYSLVPNLLKKVRVLNKAKLKVTVHFHFKCDAQSRIDIGVYINGILTGFEHENKDPSPDLAYGTALSYLNDFVTSLTLASKTLEAGEYTIEVRARMRQGTTGYVNGIFAIIEILNE
jgi:hypothetical protein